MVHPRTSTCLTLLAGVLALGCDSAQKFQGTEGQKKSSPAGSPARTDSLKDDDGNDGEGDEDDVGDAGPALDAAGGDDEGGGSDLDSFDDDSGDGEAAIQAALAECGGGDLLDAPPDKILFEKQLDSLPLTTKVLVITVTATTHLKMSVTPARSIQDATVTIDKVEGLFSGLAKGTAEKQAKDNSGVVTIDNVLPKDIGSLGDTHKVWNGTMCTFVPATKLVNERGGMRTVVSFEPPMPMQLSPKATAKRYEEEIGDQRVFSDLTVSVDETNHPELTAKTVKGKVTVTRIAPSATVDDGKGGKVEIKADVAYKMAFEFDTPKTTFLLGLQPEVSYYISYARKDLVANIVDTKAENAAPVTFLHPE